MKIATWNLERPSGSLNARNLKIIAELQRVDADILILTETNNAINLGEAYNPYATTSLAEWPEPYYKPGENRTTIWSKYPITQRVETYDAFTAVRCIIQTPLDELTIYGTVIGIHGNRRTSFNINLEKQLADWRKAVLTGNICIAGDFNISFADNYYFTTQGRQAILAFMEDYRLANLTHHIPQNIDHIVVSQSFLQSCVYKVDIWNEDKRLSDHIGVCATLTK